MPGTGGPRAAGGPVGAGLSEELPAIFGRIKFGSPFVMPPVFGSTTAKCFGDAVPGNAFILGGGASALGSSGWPLSPSAFGNLTPDTFGAASAVLNGSRMIILFGAAGDKIKGICRSPRSPAREDKSPAILSAFGTAGSLKISVKTSGGEAEDID